MSSPAPQTASTRSSRLPKRLAAGGTPEALHIIQDGAEFDLIVSDVRMPVMSGPDFIQHVRKERPDVTVLYLTGYHDLLFREQTVLKIRTPSWINLPASTEFS